MRNVVALLLLSLCAVGMATAQVTFSSTVYSPPGSPSSVVSGDFNRDGRPDIAVATATDQGLVSVFLGIGGGKFGPHADYPLTFVRPSKVLSADINNDG